jgi:hypothetical protein
VFAPDQERFIFVLEAVTYDIDLRGKAGGLYLRDLRSLGHAIVLRRMLEAALALPLPYVERLTIARVEQQVDVIG